MVGECFFKCIPMLHIYSSVEYCIIVCFYSGFVRAFLQTNEIGSTLSFCT